MKIEINIPSPQPKFPLFVQNNEKGYIVLFFSERKGIVLSKGVSSFSIGFYSDSWVPCSNQSVWTILPNETVVTFTQEQ